MAYQRIRQPKLSDVIEQELERLIVEGTLSPGQQLPPERELAKQFDVSRPSIREAIQRLEAKRLLTALRGGTFVSENIWTSFQILCEIYCLAIRSRGFTGNAPCDGRSLLILQFVAPMRTLPVFRLA